VIAVGRLDRISAEARKLKFGRAVLTILFTPLYVVGWVAGKVWLVIAYAYASIKVGWKEAV
jgi:hypothetical protein